MKKSTASKPTVGIIMGSQSDWSTMGEAAALLKQLDIPLETKIVSAHRTPKLLYSYAEEAEERGNGRESESSESWAWRVLGHGDLPSFIDLDEGGGSLIQRILRAAGSSTRKIDP